MPTDRRPNDHAQPSTRLAIAELIDFGARVLRAVGAKPEPAREVATHLVHADLTGHGSHGVMRLVQYCEHAAKGLVDPRAEPTVARESGATALVDGRGGWGPIVARFAADLASDKAAAQGIGCVAVRRAHHLGRLGVYVERAAARGQLGIAFCNVHGVARVAPWGGAERRLGTNPIAVSVPSPSGTILVDLATSAVAEGKLRLARATGREVPPSWVVDERGEPCSSPQVAYEGGSLAPLGADQGHKGSALAIAADLLAGLLPDAGCALLRPGYGNGLLIQAIEPTAFSTRTEFDRRVGEYVDYVRSARPRAGVETILLPGEIERRREAAARESGIELPAEVRESLRALAVRLGVDRRPF